MKQKISITINNKILRDVDSVIDRLYIRNRSQAFEYLIKKALKDDKIAVILAGDGKSNKSERLKNRYALKINHFTIIERAIKKLSDSGFRNIYIIAQHEALTNIFNIVGDGSSHNVKIEFIEEESFDGSATALKLLKGKIETTFLLVQCDILFEDVDLKELWQQHILDKKIVTMRICSSVIPGGRVKFGRVHMQGNKITSYIGKTIEHNVGSTIFFGGILVAEPEIFSYPGKSLDKEIFPELVKRGLVGGQMNSSEHLHIHTREDLEYARKKFK
jgi:NDP-sugar pyrophosphorylase family protein